MCKDGAYTNCTDGYSLKDDVNPIGAATAPRWDVAPLTCYDNTGRSHPHADQLRPLPWRRFSSGPRPGIQLRRSRRVSGTFRGIVVA